MCQGDEGCLDRATLFVLQNDGRKTKKVRFLTSDVRDPEFDHTLVSRQDIFPTPVLNYMKTNKIFKICILHNVYKCLMKESS